MRTTNTSSDWKGEEIRPSFIDLATNGLVKMYDPSKKLFCYRMSEVEGGKLVPEGLSRRYTIMTLIGLSRLEEGGGQSPIDVRITIDQLVQGFGDNDNVGDLGLLLWLCALAYPEHLEKLHEKYLKVDNLEQFDDFRQANTMELSWLLTGIVYAKVRTGSLLRKDEILAEQVYASILGNYGGKGIFRHLGMHGLSGKLRGRIGSFADQVYPIYALTLYNKVTGSKRALEVATECSDTICHHQGPLGQWWWHYNSATGRVIGPYPVYSVHQYGMAPMALFAIGSATGRDYQGSILRGLDWICGKNELNFNMIDEKRNVIWRCFYRSRAKLYADEVLGLLRSPVEKMERRDIHVLREFRPYCYGWLLYAFAGEVATRHLAK